MSNQIDVQIEGFEELRQKIKRLGNDKDKVKEVRKILGQVANPALKAAKKLAPVGDGVVRLKGKVYKRKKRVVRSKELQNPYVGGVGRDSIAKKVMTKARGPYLTVSPRSRKNADGFHLRQFVIPGTKKNGKKKNRFMDKAYQQTKGTMTKEAERKISRYFQKQIKRLSN